MNNYQKVLNKLYDYEKRKLQEIPKMDFLFIESPKGVFHYPLFKTEVEANYYDEVVNSVKVGSSHIHTYEEDSTGTQWFMPEENHDKDKYTHTTKPNKSERFNNTVIDYKQINNK